MTRYLNRRKLLILLLMGGLCAFFTGCFRIGEAVSSNFIPGMAMSPHPPPPVMVTDTYFDGTRHVFPLVFTPLAPIAILDLPLEIVWDVLLIPHQLCKKAAWSASERDRIAKMEPVNLALNGYFKEFQKRVRSIDTEQRAHTMEGLRGPFSGAPDKFRPYIDDLFSQDYGCGEVILDSLLCKDDTILTSHLFELGLRPSDFPHEHAVFNAVKYIKNHFRFPYRDSFGYSTRGQLLRIRLLLEYGCNPNSIPEFRCKYVSMASYDDFEGESSLDIARNVLASLPGDEFEAKHLKEIVDLLEKYGAKTAKDLHLCDHIRIRKLRDFFQNRDLVRFKEVIAFATSKEKEEAMLAIYYSGATVKEFEPYCRLLLADGTPFPLNQILYERMPPTPDKMDFIEFAFANGLQVSDYQDAPVLYWLCKRFYLNMGCDAQEVELLKLLLRLGFNPNVLVEIIGYKGTPLETRGETTALSSLQATLGRIDRFNEKTPNGEHSPEQRKMIVEAIELVKQYGGLSAKDVKKLQNTQTAPK